MPYWWNEWLEGGSAELGIDLFPAVNSLFRSCVMDVARSQEVKTNTIHRALTSHAPSTRKMCLLSPWHQIPLVFRAVNYTHMWRHDSEFVCHNVCPVALRWNGFTVSIYILKCFFHHTWQTEQVTRRPFFRTVCSDFTVTLASCISFCHSPHIVRFQCKRGDPHANSA